MKTHVLYLLVIGVLLVIIGINRCDDSTTTHTRTDVVSDSTVIDSLTTRISYLESLPPDTVTADIEIPDPDTVYMEDNRRLSSYTTSHVDSLINAFWTTTTTGELVEQEFNYILKNRRVIKEVQTRYSTRTITLKETVTKTQSLKGFLAVGGEVSTSPDQFSVSPILRYQASDGYSYHYRYDPFLQSHSVGMTIPIRIPFLSKAL